MCQSEWVYAKQGLANYLHLVTFVRLPAAKYLCDRSTFAYNSYEIGRR